MSKTPVLKDGYIDWLGANGTQYLNTGLVFYSSTTAFLVSLHDFQLNCTGICGARRGNNWQMMQISTDSSAVYFHYKDNRVSFSTPLEEGVDHNLVFDKNTITIDGTVVYNFTTLYHNTVVPAYLFAINSGGNIVNLKSIPTKVKRFAVWSSGVLKLDWRPYIKDGVACMYDEVSKTFKYNDGTGEFLIPQK